jgi:hypothetical protein
MAKAGFCDEVPPTTEQAATIESISAEESLLSGQSKRMRRGIVLLCVLFLTEVSTREASQHRAAQTLLKVAATAEMVLTW